MEIINKFGLICKPTTQVYMDYNNLKLIFNTEWNKCLNIMKLNKGKIDLKLIIIFIITKILYI